MLFRSLVFRKLAEDNANLKRRCKHTILRLGALTDDPGMVPLVFGAGDDSIVMKTTDDGTHHNRPPIISRSDAARMMAFLVLQDWDCDDDDDDDDSDSHSSLTILDCAWKPKYGRDSVGREETISAAGRQDLHKAIREALHHEAM